MEKRRRARINNCLNELKTLILDATKKDVSHQFIHLCYVQLLDLSEFSLRLKLLCPHLGTL